MVDDVGMPELLDIAKNIPKITELYRERDRLQAQVNEIDRQIKSLLATPVAPNRHLGAFKTYKHPKEGTAGYDMVEILRGNEPMSKEEIEGKLENREGKKDVSSHTVRSYLSNFKCFQRVSKNKWRYRADSIG